MTTLIFSIKSIALKVQIDEQQALADEIIRVGGTPSSSFLASLADKRDKFQLYLIFLVIFGISLLFSILIEIGLSKSNPNDERNKKFDVKNDDKDWFCQECGNKNSASTKSCTECGELKKFS